MRMSRGEVHLVLRRKLVSRLVEEGQPRRATWHGSQPEVLNIGAIDRMMAFRSHPLYHEIRAALGRMESGTYGRCTLCRSAIPTESLMSDPIARVCDPCGVSLRRRARHNECLSC